MDPNKYSILASNIIDKISLIKLKVILQYICLLASDYFLREKLRLSNKLFLFISNFYLVKYFSYSFPKELLDTIYNNYAFDIN